MGLKEQEKIDAKNKNMPKVKRCPNGKKGATEFNTKFRRGEVALSVINDVS